MSKDIKISIVTVVFNGESTIERTIKSVLSQKYKNIEYIIIDGGSTDNTVKIIEKYKDDIAYFHSKNDRGIYDAMNQGIAVATGDFIGLINSDDWLRDNAIELVVDALQNNENIDILHANMYIIENNNSKLAKPTKNLKNFFWRGMLYMHPTYYVKKNIYKELQYDSNYKLLSDYKFTMECFDNEYVFYYLDRALVNFSAGGASSVFWKRIVEGHNIRKELGFNIAKVYLSTMFRILLTLASNIKKKIK